MIISKSVIRRRGDVGRRRDPSLDAKVLRAAADCLSESGYKTFAVEAVASRVGIPKSTIYKRWPSREELLSRTISDWALELSRELAAHEGRGIRAYLVALVEQEIMAARSRTGRAAAHLLLDRHDGGTPTAPLVDALSARRDNAIRVVQASVDSGELRAATKADGLVDAAIGMVWGSIFAGSIPTRRGANRIVDGLLESVLNGPAAAP